MGSGGQPAPVLRVGVHAPGRRPGAVAGLRRTGGATRAILVALVLASIAFAGCGSTTVPSSTSSSSPRVVAPTVSPTIAVGSPASSPASPIGPLGSYGPGEIVQVDSGLLSFTPPGGNGLVQTPDPG